MKFILALVAVVAGQPHPSIVTREMPTLEECMKVATEVLQKSAPEVSENLPEIAVSCHAVYSPDTEKKAELPRE